MPMPHHSVLLTLVATCLLLVQGAAGAASPPATHVGTKVIAVINGHNVTNIDFGTFVASRVGQAVTPANLTQQQLNALQEEYINRELVYQDAVAKGMDKHPEVLIAIENQRHNIIAGFALRQMVSAPLPEKALQEAYKTLASKPVKQYLASHILVKTEAEARALIDSLKQGADFARLAQENSVDASAQNGGQLGWLAAEQILEPVREALGRLKTGSYSTTPVQSQFGWHVLKLDETRILPPPDFEEVRDELSQHLHNENIARYITQLRQNSTIEIREVRNE